MNSLAKGLDYLYEAPRISADKVHRHLGFLLLIFS